MFDRVGFFCARCPFVELSSCGTVLLWNRPLVELIANTKCNGTEDLIMNALLTKTPNDVLLDGKRPIGPKLLGSVGGLAGVAIYCVAIYGFSDKQPDDLFLNNDADQVAISYRLTLDRKLQAYVVEKALSGFEMA